MLMDLYWQDVFHQPTRFEETRHGTGIVTGECILEAVNLVAGRDLVYAFELRRGDRLTVAISASQSVDFTLCTFANYERWLDSPEQVGEIEAIEAIDGATALECAFQSPGDEEIVLLISSPVSGTQVLVEAHQAR
jgi:hypothetical protein